MTNKQKVKKVVLVTKENLPVYCPPPEQQLSNMHPRVYIALRPGEEKRCPYCSNLFKYPL